jgi:hypothetical protein
MTTVPLPVPVLRPNRDGYGHARMPRGATVPEPERIDRVEYGRFRNVYLYITEACQLRCDHCYMGERLDRALKMPLSEIVSTLATWRRMGGSKLTVLPVLRRGRRRRPGPGTVAASAASLRRDRRSIKRHEAVGSVALGSTSTGETWQCA